jgi:hypothetical protein
MAMTAGEYVFVQLWNCHDLPPGVCAVSVIGSLLVGFVIAATTLALVMAILSDGCATVGLVVFAICVIVAVFWK